MRQRTGASTIDSGRAELQSGAVRVARSLFPFTREAESSFEEGRLYQTSWAVLVWRKGRVERTRFGFRKIKVRREVGEKDERKSNELEGSVRRLWIGLD